MVNKYCSIFLILIFAWFNAPAQISNKFHYQDLKKRFPNESFVVLELDQEDVVEINNNQPEIRSYFKERLLSLNKNARGMASRNMGFNYFTEITEIDAKAYIPSGKRYKSKRVKDFVEKDVIAQNGISFYNGSKKIEFEFSALKEGSVTEVITEKKINDFHLLNNTVISRHYFIKKSTYTLKVDNRIDIGIHQFNFNDSCISFNKEVGKKYTYFKWEMNDCEKIRIYGDESNSLHYRATVEPYIKSYTIDGQKTEVFNGLDGLYRWYNSLVSQVDRHKTAELKVLADSIVQGSKSEKEKVKRIYKWVQNNIKYIALGDGYGGYVPRDPDLVLQRRYGDCKDMSSLTISLLDQVGVQSYFSWVGTRKIPFSYSEVATPLVDNHMIVTFYDKNNRAFFIDPTDSRLELGFPSAFIQGKEVLIGINDSLFRLDTVPVIRAEKNVENDTASIEIAQGGLIGKGKLIFSGYLAAEIQNDLLEGDSLKQLDFMNRAFTKGNNKYYTKSFQLAYDPNKTDSLRVDYEFEIPDYIKQIDDNIYFNLNLTQQLKGYKIDEKQNIPFLFDYNNILNKVYHLKKPDTYSISYLPEDFELSNDLMDCTISYKTQNDTLRYQLRFKHKVLQLEVDQVAEWNASIEKISNELNKTIKLTKQ